MGPWTTAEIESARAVPFHLLLRFLGAYCKLDREYKSVGSVESIRVHVNHAGRDFRFVFTGEKWINELLSPLQQGRGGAGAIDLAAHLTGLDFVRSVKICIDALNDSVSKVS
ncbi:hypothetical protein [Paraburkholderia terrae]|uniref:hypothetical protein n=1 Tax=Paraburkholderia TaxID=1822464 RepID=UPI001EE24317|nr:hypothetical protein [Paraburkholderia terrae]BEU21246.1 hypothetical protein PBP221_13860 [Paraburkholderia sp. 22B1P]BEU28015.1 hypothetical protein PBP221_81550 [Paraburkholderia sp. 22B1P]GJH07104.1 hypothetical protein CBA19C8_41125 [Paraburkholderia terrae]GJH39424.1 hypothetical protein CBA19CS91_41725 [Paraburkholderia hospita]